MRQRRHAATRLARTGGLRIALVLGTLLLAVSGSAYAYDRVTSGHLLPGVTIAGVNVGGMSRDQAIEALADVAEERLNRQIVVRAGDRTWHVTPDELGARAEVAGAVDRAFALTDSFSLASRVMHRILGRSVDRSIDLHVAPNEERTEWFVGIVEESVFVSARDAAIRAIQGETDEEDRMVIRAPAEGISLRSDPAVRRLSRTIASAERDQVTFGVRRVEPELSADELGHTIVVRLSENTLYLYDGLDVARTFPVATGLGGFPTPQGDWEIVEKKANPTWYNPAPDGWGRDLPPSIPPGPGNPLGTHALYLNASGIRIHGTYDYDSIGTFASHGCIRMYLEDSQELFDTVDVGTPVLIYW
jgi:lipoprotein-anchoring transpeptidase ErfK/SrfK